MGNITPGKLVVVSSGGVVIGGVYVITGSPLEFVIVVGIVMPVGIVMSGPSLEIIVCPSEFVLVTTGKMVNVDPSVVVVIGVEIPVGMVKVCPPLVTTVVVGVTELPVDGENVMI